MKNLYIVNDGKTAFQFTDKRKAAKLVKDLEKAGKIVTFTTSTYYPPSYIEMMKYQYRMYKVSTYTDVRHAYKTQPSIYKIRSFERIKNAVLPGTIKVISHNCMQYTTGSLITDSETRELLFRYDTKNHLRVIPLSLIED